MGVFRSKSKANANVNNADKIQIKISSKDEQEYKMHSANIHDPILTAVNEQQPFEQAAQRDNRRPSYLSQSSHEMKDIFGNPIVHQDMSNPTRARNERPLDTIRGFEYAITGDLQYRDQLESQRLGWNFHEDFHYQNLMSTQSANEGYREANDFSKPVANFSEQPMYQAGNYSASSLRGDGNGKKKKKKGMFSRKK
jgi:hypothetical protein